MPACPANWLTQRYYVMDDYFNPQFGPVILYICGEATCKGFNGNHSWVGVLAQQFHGIVLSLEHRYYGSSYPLGSKSLEDEALNYLTVEQAMADLAYFTNWVKSNGMHKVTKDNPW